MHIYSNNNNNNNNFIWKRETGKDRAQWPFYTHLPTHLRCL